MSNLFEGEAKGEVIALRDQLDGNSPTERKNAAKRCIALMRSGENVQCLFSSMLRCVKTTDLELKKLTYLYLMTYSAHEPEQAIMAVNTFIQDSQDSNPLVRALAVRTMCRIKLESVAEHMILPLKKALSDTEAYVRKTAAFGVAKLYDVIPEAVENSQLFPELLKLLKDELPIVVSNTTAAICEINEKRSSPIFSLNGDTVGPLLNAIQQSSEWCQIILFDALSKYVPESKEDAAFLIDRLIPYLKHKNPAVVIGSFKCIFLYMDSDSRNPADIFPQIIPPYLTLVTSSEPEIQFLILRTLTLFVLKYPKALAKEIRTFFCKYNDPSYIKMEKLDIIVTICSPMTAQLVLDELAEYCNEVDVAFVRKSIRSVAQIAVKVEAAARRCVDILVGLIKGKADYAIEESIIVMCDILRKFVGVFDSVITNICSNLETIKEPRAKAASIWILGEYSSRIEGVDVLLDPYLDTFHDEQPLVQLQILSSLVKVFISKPDETRDQLQFVLTEATKESNSPDVRNRAMIYWRLLSVDSQSAKDIVVFSKDTIINSGLTYDESVLSELIRNMGSVSGVLHIIPSNFLRKDRFVPEDETNSDIIEVEKPSSMPNFEKVQINNESIISVFIRYEHSNMFLNIYNLTSESLEGFDLAINKNCIGLAVLSPPQFPLSLGSGSSEIVNVPIQYISSAIGNAELNSIQIAIKTNLGNVLVTSRVPVEFSLPKQVDFGIDMYRSNFSNFSSQLNFTLDRARIADKSKLIERNITVIGVNQQKTYISFSLPEGTVYVGELTQNESGVTVFLKASSSSLFQSVQQSAIHLFTNQ